MPRKKAVSDVQELNNEVVLTLAPGRPHRKGQHDEDPYESPPGAVPQVISSEPIKRKMTARDLAVREEARIELKARAERYARYLDAMTEFGGDQEQALAEVYGIPVEEARLHRLDLHADLIQGIGGIAAAELLERNDVTLSARISQLRKHLYSANAAASLKAIDLLNELEGNRQDQGSFESFLRLAKQQKR